jgi:hypothetical protein
MAYTGSKAVIGRGSIFSIGPVQGTSSPTFTPIGEITDMGVTGRTFDKIEVSNFDSAIDKEYIKGLREPGSGDITYNRVADDAGQVALEAAFEDSNAYLFKLQLPPGKGQTVGEVWTFAALVMSVDPPSISPSKVIQGKLSLQVTGPRTITAGS